MRGEGGFIPQRQRQHHGTRATRDPDKISHRGIRPPGQLEHETAVAHSARREGQGVALAGDALDATIADSVHLDCIGQWVIVQQQQGLVATGAITQSEPRPCGGVGKTNVDVARRCLQKLVVEAA